MKQSKLYTLLSITTLICLLGAAAICNLGGKATDSEELDQSGAFEESVVVIENTGTEETAEQEIGEAEVSPERDNQPPVITDITFSSAIIIPGNTYDVTAISDDPDGDELYYEWGVSNGIIDEWQGWNLDTMKWTTPNEEDTVAVTARVYDNNGGIHARTEDIEVRYQQIEMEAETQTEMQAEMEMSALLQMEFPLVWSESGHIRFNRNPEEITDQTGFPVGDSKINEHMKSFASYDISGFSGGEIQKATLTLKFIRQSGDISFWDSFDIYYASWGPRALINSDYHLMGILLESYPVSITGDMICDVPLLKQKIQEAIEQGSTRFQVMFFFNPTLSNNNDLGEGWTIGRDSSLKITYES